MNIIFEVTLETINSLKNAAQGKDGKYLEVENGKIYVLPRDIDYIFENYIVKKVECKGQLFGEEE